MFELTHNSVDRLIHVHMSGFFTVAEVEEFSRQEQALVVKLGWNRSGFNLLVTTSGDFVQSPEVVAALRRAVTDSQYKARRIAVVRGSALTQMQTRRIIAREETNIFSTVEEAREWLLT